VPGACFLKEKEAKTKFLIKLLKLKPEQELKSREFQKRVKFQKSIIGLWKRYYNYSRSDPRYLEATYEDIMEDIIAIKADEHIRFFESHDKETNDYLKKSTLDPSFIAKDREKMQRDADEIMKQLDGLIGKRGERLG
jgi:hypothetical protein